METILAKHQDMQEKIAEDMMLIARSLKDHSMAARDIIKADTKVSIELTVKCIPIVSLSVDMQV